MTFMSIEIRPAVATDLPRMMGLDHACTSDYVWQLDLRKETGQVSATLREVRLPRPVSVAYPRDPFALADEWQFKDAVLVAVDASVMGYVCVVEQSAATVAWVTDLVVAPDQRRRGIGTALLKAAQDWAVERGSAMLFFESQAKNQPAIRMAHKSGLEFCGYNDHYYANQDVALFFGRTLK
jgi:ribosomal protein S18 acetylase RimI-like enzyme